MTAAALGIAARYSARASLVGAQRVPQPNSASRSEHAANPSVQAVAATVFDLPIVIPAPGEYVADGAARQAAWALLGGSEPPPWNTTGEVLLESQFIPHVRAAYRHARESVHGI